MNILICDDDIQYVEDVRRHVEQYMRERTLEPSIFTTTNPKTVLQGKAVYDLAFLDIRMQDVNGISVARELKRRNGKILLFFITAFGGYQDNAMDVRAFRFFEKPFDPQRLYKGLDRALEYIDRAYVDVYVLDADERVQKRIPMDEIVFVKTENRKTYLRTKDAQYVTNGTLDEWEEKLSPRYFYRVHKSYLINLHDVTEYRPHELYLCGTVRVPIPTRRQADFRRYWFEYLKRRR